MIGIEENEENDKNATLRIASYSAERAATRAAFLTRSLALRAAFFLRVANCLSRRLFNLVLLSPMGLPFSAF